MRSFTATAHARNPDTAYNVYADRRSCAYTRVRSPLRVKSGYLIFLNVYVIYVVSFTVDLNRKRCLCASVASLGMAFPCRNYVTLPTPHEILIEGSRENAHLPILVVSVPSQLAVPCYTFFGAKISRQSSGSREEQWTGSGRVLRSDQSDCSHSGQLLLSRSKIYLSTHIISAGAC